MSKTVLIFPALILSILFYAILCCCLNIDGEFRFGEVVRIKKTNRLGSVVERTASKLAYPRYNVLTRWFGMLIENSYYEFELEHLKDGEIKTINDI